MANKVLPRNKMDKKFTWNAESVFPSREAWEKELNQVIEDTAKIKLYQGRLAENPSVLLDALNELTNLVSRAQTAFMYAGFAYAVDTIDQQAAGMRSKAQGMSGRVSSSIDRKSTRLNSSHRL